MLVIGQVDTIKIEPFSFIQNAWKGIAKNIFFHIQNKSPNLL